MVVLIAVGSPFGSLYLSHQQSSKRKLRRQVLSTQATHANSRRSQAWVGLVRAHATTVRRFNAQLVADHGLTINDYEVLLHLVAGGGPAAAPRRSRRARAADAVRDHAAARRARALRLRRARLVRPRRARHLRTADRRGAREAARRHPVARRRDPRVHGRTLLRRGAEALGRLLERLPLDPPGRPRVRRQRKSPQRAQTNFFRALSDLSAPVRLPLAPSTERE